jgi:hypothetical protein
MPAREAANNDRIVYAILLALAFVAALVIGLLWLVGQAVEMLGEWYAD